MFGWLERHLSPREESKFFLVQLIPPRKTFPFDMNAEERAVMERHVAYWVGLVTSGQAIVFGLVLDPEGPWGVGILRVRDEAEAHALEARDPALLSERGFLYQVLPMPTAVSA